MKDAIKVSESDQLFNLSFATGFMLASIPDEKTRAFCQKMIDKAKECPPVDFHRAITQLQAESLVEA